MSRNICLQLPGRSGFDLIREIRTDPILAAIPIVILSGSNDRKDPLTAFCLGAQFFFQKPTEMAELTRLVSMMHVYWTSGEIVKNKIALSAR